MTLKAILGGDPYLGGNHGPGKLPVYQVSFIDFLFIYKFFFYIVFFNYLSYIYIFSLLLSLISNLIYSLIILFSL